MHWCISFLKYIPILDQKRRLQYQQELKLTNQAKKKKKANRISYLFIVSKRTSFMSLTFSFKSLYSN